MSNSKYKLKKTAIGTRGYYLYEVINTETNEVLTTRKSKREYVAATINGRYFFGRVDLVGKGEHGSSLKWVNSLNPNGDSYAQSKYTSADIERFRKELIVAYL